MNTISRSGNATKSWVGWSKNLGWTNSISYTSYSTWMFFSKHLTKGIVRWDFHKSSSKNMLFFFHCCVWYVVVLFPQFLFRLSNDFGFFPNVMLIFLTCSKISEPDNYFGGSLSSMFPLNWTRFNWNLCPLDKNRRWPIKHHLLLNGRRSEVASKLQDGQAKPV